MSAELTIAASGIPVLHVHQGVAVWAGGATSGAVDVWFHPAFGDSHLSYRGVFASALGKQARLFVYDPPGHGASPPRPRGLTIGSAVHLWCDLIAHFSASRPLVLLGHSMAGIIASRTARSLDRSAALVIGVEANLTRADAYFTGLAARFDDPEAFYGSLLSRIWRLARHDEVVRRFASSLQFADPRTLWTLGRSVWAQHEPGADFRRLRCRKIHYWDASGSSSATRAYVARHQLPQRRLDGLGHWPMIKAPDQFGAAIADDIGRLQHLSRRRK
jgi:pimeloyl-ACP methyl ester carboxylesterase